MLVYVYYIFYSMLKDICIYTCVDTQIQDCKVTSMCTPNHHNEIDISFPIEGQTKHTDCRLFSRWGPSTAARGATCSTAGTE